MKKRYRLFGGIMEKVVCLMALCGLAFLSACKKAEDMPIEGQQNVPEKEVLQNIEGGCETPPEFHNEIYAIGDVLYYCDPERDAALYAHNMKTGGEVLVTSTPGQLYRTQRGNFFLVDTNVYKVAELELTLFCEMPEDGEFLDLYQDNIVWVKRERHTKEYKIGSKTETVTRFTRQSVWLQEMEDTDEAIRVSTEASEEIYHLSREIGYIGDVGVTSEGVYIGLADGMYYSEFGAKEAKCLFEEEIQKIYPTTDEFVMFESYDETGYDCLFLLDTETREIQKIEGSETSDFALIQDGKLYYDGTAIRSYHIADGSYKVLSEGDLYSAQDYSEAVLYGKHLIMRHITGGYFAELDLRNNRIKRVN